MKYTTNITFKITNLNIFKNNKKIFSRLKIVFKYFLVEIFEYELNND